jgi:hypothetical protein
VDWRATLGAIAPTLATALGGPFAGLAVETIGKALGLDQPTLAKVRDTLANGQMNGEQIAAIRQAEIAFRVRMRELDIQEEQLTYADKASARQMQVSTRSVIPPVLSVVVVVLVGVAEGSMLFGAVPSVVDPIILGRVLGTLDSALMLVLSFYFGSSNGSERKTEMMAAAADKAVP